jgi:hypothetical protein
MVGFHLQVLHAECKGMVEREDRVDLANMYRLLKPIAGAQRGEILMWWWWFGEGGVARFNVEFSFKQYIRVSHVSHNLCQTDVFFMLS